MPIPYLGAERVNDTHSAWCSVRAPKTCHNNVIPFASAKTKELSATPSCSVHLACRPGLPTAVIGNPDIVSSRRLTVLRSDPHSQWSTLVTMQCCSHQISHIFCSYPERTSLLCTYATLQQYLIMYEKRFQLILLALMHHICLPCMHCSPVLSSPKALCRRRSGTRGA